MVNRYGMKVDGRKNRKKVKKPLKPAQRRRLKKAMEGNQNALGNAGGRPPIEYTAKIGKIVYEMHLSMRPVTDICRVIEISPDTYYKWLKEIPEFADKVFQGTEGIDNKITRALSAKAAGFKARVEKPIKVKDEKTGADKIVNHVYVEYHPPDTRAIELWLKNRSNLKNQWSNLPDEATPPPPTITVNNNAVDISKLSDAAIKEIFRAINPENTKG
jgi:hypothetical protein